jgi:hypothetical protein
MCWRFSRQLIELDFFENELSASYGGIGPYLI